MLQGDFFNIMALQTEGDVTRATLALNASHPIFDGHFPGQPVVPGVCMLQILKEILELVSKRHIRLVKADEMKFLAVIDPSDTNIVQAELTQTIANDNQIRVSGKLFTDKHVHFKLKASFMIEEH